MRAILKSRRISLTSLSLIFLSDRKIRTINKQYLDHDYPTDILTFDYLAGDPDHDKRKASRRVYIIEGEIFISLDTAARNAKVYQTTLLKEITLYLAHGILHLLGYDDHTEADIKRIRREEKRLLRLFYQNV